MKKDFSVFVKLSSCIVSRKCVVLSVVQAATSLALANTLSVIEKLLL